MDLQNQVELARRKIVKDGFDMSLGEIMRIYERGELIINPEYQRLFRWDSTRKTNFIESILLNIPIPPIFVFTDETGKWELIDGLQRLSTVFQFAGILRDAEGELVDKFVPNGTRLLPDLDNSEWSSDDENTKILPLAIRLDMERVRLRVEILKRESDAKAKYELFQRLNTGGASLSPQEVRNCVAVMLNKGFYSALSSMAEDANFVKTTDMTERAREEQKHNELVLRYLAYRYKTYDQAIDVHDWLDDILIDIANNEKYPVQEESIIFARTFNIINDALGVDAFKRYESGNFSGGFLISPYETITNGVSRNIDFVEKCGVEYLRNAVIRMWTDERFRANARAGVRGSTRLGKVLPLVDEWFSK
ncbi:DUF262 domain-containing protein [Paraburkholderia gardini]|uniref:GmrSD restriction endonucleases N-terminal domain-containing protein n=1 Tax=Paraburkholderia gardini TaxID=2823469 RepID=A0ABM8UAB5_9BURK|nr:DUF262 domain-containing protein [Paraburkholderia gardini]CAG4920662.1 hypothetical protein R54767_04736 [Paraburkholderia gardini]